jgi:hypothetical protein
MIREPFNLVSRRAGCWARQISIAVIVAMVCTIPLQLSEAQIVSGDPSSVSQRFTYMAWTMKGDTADLTVTQWFVPIILKAGLADDWELAVFSAAAGSDADWDIEGSDPRVSRCRQERPSYPANAVNSSPGYRRTSSTSR